MTIRKVSTRGNAFHLMVNLAQPLSYLQYRAQPSDFPRLSLTGFDDNKGLISCCTASSGMPSRVVYCTPGTRLPTLSSSATFSFSLFSSSVESPSEGWSVSGWRLAPTIFISNLPRLKVWTTHELSPLSQISPYLVSPIPPYLAKDVIPKDLAQGNCLHAELDVDRHLQPSCLPCCQTRQLQFLGRMDSFLSWAFFRNRTVTCPCW